MNIKYIVYLVGGCVLGFCYPFVRTWLGSDTLSVVIAAIYVVMLRLAVLVCLERKSSRGQGRR